MRSAVCAAVAVLVLAPLAGCGTRPAGPNTINEAPPGASSAKAALTAFLRALERRDGTGMRQMMTPAAQENESNPSFGLLETAPELTGFKILRVNREGPVGNASPAGALTSLRYTVALTPAGGFDNADTEGDAYEILVAETHDKRWLVAELGGCC